MWLGVEKTGRQTENHFEAVTEEGLEAVRGAAGVYKVQNAIKDFGSRSNVRMGRVGA